MTANRAESSDDEDPDQPIFSTITGKYRQARRYGGSSVTIQHEARFTEIGVGTDIPSVSNEESGPSAVILRNHQNVVSKLSESAAGNSILSHCDPHFNSDIFMTVNRSILT